VNPRRFAVPAALSLTLVVCSAVCGQPPQRPKLLGIAHYAVFAHDLEKSRAYYRDFLGFEEPYSLKDPEIAFFKVNDHQYIELAPEREANTDRLNHLSFETNDIEALRQYLASKGIKVPAKATKVRIGNLAFNITDPEGHTIEMTQYLPDGQTARAYGKFMTDKRISTRIMHVGIIVTHLDAEMHFYQDVLGFSEIWRGSSAGQILSWVNMKLPDSKDYVEFMLFKDAPAPTKRGSAHHVALEVPDIEAAVAKLKATPYCNEVYKRDIQIRTGINRKHQVNLFDPDGTREELMEPRTVDGKPAPSSTAPAPQ
jgi:catechol 2,3-dioxygenase-like lactoylglutathione lyase family enzyme